MNLNHRIEQILEAKNTDNQPIEIELSRQNTMAVYPRSIHHLENDLLFIGRLDGKKGLFTIPAKGSKSASSRLTHGEPLSDSSLVYYPLSRENAAVLRDRFEFLRPIPLGPNSSLGLGDRLGVATPGHIRAVQGRPIKAIFAQQSMRELERTEREPEDVVDAATWGVFQEGYLDRFGADADHLKTADHIDRMIRAGFTFYTFDPGAFVVNEAAGFSDETLSTRIPSLSWGVLNDTPKGFLARYDGKEFRLSSDCTLSPTTREIRQALVKYGGVIVHALSLYRHLKEAHRGKPSEVELSVDETDSTTSPFEHFLVANELKRLGVEIVSLAPRFIGDFEKGIDYKGDINLFKKEYAAHAAIAKALGPYKISIHSGSDKFSVYRAIGDLNCGPFHVKTAGTNWLEALRTVAREEPVLFAEILDFARSHYEKDKASYFVSAKLENILPAKFYAKDNLIRLLDDNHARQVLHVTYGSILTARDETGRLVFKDRILLALDRHEASHYDILRRHIDRHIQPFMPSLSSNPER